MNKQDSDDQEGYHSASNQYWNGEDQNHHPGFVTPMTVQISFFCVQVVVHEQSTWENLSHSQGKTRQHVAAVKRAVDVEWLPAQDAFII